MKNIFEEGGTVGALFARLTNRKKLQTVNGSRISKFHFLEPRT